ncbi:hypothetical protein [Kitasatospora sp. NPDC087315]|uniref:hypothetical protein n=1 Tax=Kitasatospora sp. NPDC087315 TaxID=3364069 RepID=UPI0038191D3C
MTTTVERPAGGTSIDRVKDARSLLTPTEFTDVLAVVMRNNPEMAHETAERVVTQSLAFVAACSEFPQLRLKPSRVVDEGWHAQILCTRIYARLCGTLGLFVHHVPEAPDVTRHDPDALRRTRQAITAAGYTVDAELWGAPTDTAIPVAASCEHSEPPPAGCGFDCSNTGPN